MYSEEKMTSRREIYDGKVVKLYVDDVELDNGHKTKRELIRHPGGVCVLPLDEEGSVYMVKQFRYPFQTALYELPAGKLEFGENHRECGIRELKEETGATADSFEYLGCIYPTEGEFLDVIKLPFDKVFDMAMNGGLPDAKTQAAVLKTKLLMLQNKGE